MGRMPAVRFVDVFSESTCRGNALAVFHDADDLTDEQMATIARWTNLSETTFLCAPTDPGADYRVRIWTTGGELPFAGHPTLGSAHAWLEAGGVPASEGVVVQQCAAGLVEVRRGERLRFAAPPLTRSGPVSAAEAERVATALGLDPADVLETAWVDNGPGWVGVLLRLTRGRARGGPGPQPAAPGSRPASSRSTRPVPATTGWPPRCGRSTPTAATSPRTPSPAASTRGWPSGSCRPATCPSTTSPRRAPSSAGSAGCTSTWSTAPPGWAGPTRTVVTGEREP